MTKNGIKAIPISSFDSTGLLLATWKAITPVGGLPYACSIIKINNATKLTDVFISYDGVDYHDVVPYENQHIIYLQTNSRPGNKKSLFKKGTNVYLRGDPAFALGYIYLIGYYQEQ